MSTSKSKAKRMKKNISFTTYINKVLKARPGENDSMMTKTAVGVLNQMCNHLFSIIAEEAKNISIYTGKKTVTVSHVRAALEIVLPNELSKGALQAGDKAIQSYAANLQKKN